MLYKKTMIYLDPGMHRQLRYMALDEGVSMAEMIRRAVADYLKAHAPRKAVRK
jgi:predicted HicB family RNase H-like nuclease